MHLLRRTSSVVAVSLIGTLLVVAGIVMLVTPGPGLLAIAAGLAVWAKEFRWARWLLDRARQGIARRRGRTPRPLPVEPTADDDRDLQQVA